jgi:hypothetical protein
MKESVVAGRVAVYVPEHPAANNRGYILRSRYVMEQKLGRHLDSTENVHHINGNCRDDREENLKLASRSEHVREHWARGDLDSVRKLDYTLIARLIREGYGYKRIAKMTGFNVHSVQSACRIIRLGHK